MPNLKIRSQMNNAHVDQASAHDRRAPRHAVSAPAGAAQEKTGGATAVVTDRANHQLKLSRQRD
jgi:hypothetical protein